MPDLQRQLIQAMNDNTAYLGHPVRLVCNRPLGIPESGTVRRGFPSLAENLRAKGIDLTE